MQVENHKEEVPFSHYSELFAKLDPAEVTQRLPFVSFAEGKFSVELLGRPYRIAWPEYALEGGSIPLPMQTFLLRCLIGCKDEPWQGTWKTFREMPWGEMYNGPYTGRVLTRAAFSFGTRVEAFRAAAEKLGATPLRHGDAGFEFDFFGPYKMQIMVWAGDDEFPPNAQVLYTDNFAAGFAAEDRVVSGDILISHIKAAM